MNLKVVARLFILLCASVAYSVILPLNGGCGLADPFNSSSDDNEVANNIIGSLDDGSSSELISSQTSSDVNLSAMTVVFSQAMDDSLFLQETASTGGLISLTCQSSVGAAAIEVAIRVLASSEPNTYVIYPAEAWRYAKMNCTLSFSSEIKSLSGTKLGTSVSYPLASGCALSDSYSENTESCWSLDEGSSFETWDDIDEGLMNINPSSGFLEVSSGGRDPVTIIMTKEVNVNPDGFEIIAHFKSIEIPNSDQEFLLFGLSERQSVERDSGKNIRFGINQSGGQSHYCNLEYSSDSVNGENTPYEVVAITDCSNLDEIYVKLSRENGVLSVSYSEDGSTYQDLDLVVGALPQDQDFSDMGYFYIMYSIIENNDSESSAILVESVELSGISSTGQY